MTSSLGKSLRPVKSFRLVRASDAGGRGRVAGAARAVARALHGAPVMIVNTLFARGGSFVRGEVEVKLMPGIPQLHVVGLPDRSIRECGLRLKSALKSAGFAWPRGHQIIVNLRPSYERKESAGTDLAIALGVLLATGQLGPGIAGHLGGALVYGELTLDGRIFAPGDVGRAARALEDEVLLTGPVAPNVRLARWLELDRLDAAAVRPRARVAGRRPRAPDLPGLKLTGAAFDALCLTAHLGLSVLVAGPQGSGKSTWARLVHALSPEPDPSETRERARWFGDDASGPTWRPLEQPHHTTTPLAMIGGGRPLRPGVLSRAHGGVLIMDEFLEFHPAVLESLREPLETGAVEVSRLGERARLPARVQLVGTTNLCPCGELSIGRPTDCGYSPTVCRRTTARLSGPVLDRFDLLVPSHAWLEEPAERDVAEARRIVARLADFRASRGEADDPGHRPLAGLSHRRATALAKVARGLADVDESREVKERHRQRAYRLVQTPIERLRRTVR